MKKTVKILALIMTLMMAFVCFTACDEKASDEKDDEEKTEAAADDKDKKDDDEKAVKEVVEAYYEARLEKIDDADELLDNVEQYLDADGKLYEEIEEDVKAMEEEEGSVDIWNAVNESKEIEIGEIEIDEDKATVEVELTIADRDSCDKIYDEKVNELLEEFLMSDACEYTYGEQPYMTVSNFYNDISEELRTQLTRQFSSMYKEQFIDAYCDAVKEADTETEDQTVTLKKIDGEWLITKIK